jgi:hypothetical protein
MHTRREVCSLTRFFFLVNSYRQARRRALRRRNELEIEHGYVGDFEAGTLFYERQQKKGRRTYQLGPADAAERFV